ncbi:Herpesvirus [Vigna unguiculata]|uniref:Herpesvirus n=1 Tax=Vigna unguiculata TaxID=3917 RepID=A0A4D6NC84_VIGUN|nr:Herpesvirus [Vigna unguiculata]
MALGKGLSPTFHRLTKPWKGLAPDPNKPNIKPRYTFKSKPIKRLNNKGHAQKDPIGLHPRWPKSTWASHTLHMGQRRCEDLKRSETPLLLFFEWGPSFEVLMVFSSAFHEKESQADKSRALASKLANIRASKQSCSWLDHKIAS